MHISIRIPLHHFKNPVMRYYAKGQSRVHMGPPVCNIMSSLNSIIQNTKLQQRKYS